MIDEYIDQLARRLSFSGRARSRILTEARDHLEDATAHLEMQGMAPGAARARAVAAFGSADDLARQFDAQIATAAMRRTPLLIGVSAIAVVGGFLFAAVTQPQSAMPGKAGIVVQLAFFVATVGAQVAVVAGGRAASLVAARWRVSTAGVPDREQVRDAAEICIGGLVVGALGWTVALLVATGSRPQSRAATLSTGIVVMMLAASAGLIGLRRQIRPECGAMAQLQPDSSAWRLDLGERAIRVVRRWPALVCAGVAIIAALFAMSAAETTVVGALPSGIFEAAAVVAGFVVLGPRLGLREASERGDRAQT